MRPGVGLHRRHQVEVGQASPQQAGRRRVQRDRLGHLDGPGGAAVGPGGCPGEDRVAAHLASDVLDQQEPQRLGGVPPVGRPVLQHPTTEVRAAPGDHAGTGGCRLGVAGIDDVGEDGRVGRLEPDVQLPRAGDVDHRRSPGKGQPDAGRCRAVAESAVDGRFGRPQGGDRFGTALAYGVEVVADHRRQDAAASELGMDADPGQPCRRQRPAGYGGGEAVDGVDPGQAPVDLGSGGAVPLQAEGDELVVHPTGECPGVDVEQLGPTLLRQRYDGGRRGGSGHGAEPATRHRHRHPSSAAAVGAPPGWGEGPRRKPSGG